MTCPYCNGPLEKLGTLGNKDAWRCRNCGLEVLTGHIEETLEEER